MPYQIRVNCTCGKILKVPEDYAGKRGKCPNCGRKITVPSLDEIRKKQPVAKEVDTEVRHCPTCGAYLNPGDTVCVSCRTNLSTGEWDTEGKREAAPAPSKPWYVAGIITLVIFLLAGGGYLIFSQFLVPRAAPTLAPPSFESTSEGWARELKKIVDTADTTPENLEVTLKGFENFMEKSSKVPLREYNLLQTEYRLAKLAKAFSGEKNPMARWLKVREMQAQQTDAGGNTRIEKQRIDKITKEQTELEEEIVYRARERKERAKTLVENQQYGDLLTQTADWFQEVVKSSYPIEPLHRELAEYTEMCRQPGTLAKIDTANPQTTKTDNEPKIATEDEQNLKALRDKLNEFLPNYRDSSQKWEFTKLLFDTASLAEEAKQIIKKFPEDPDLPKIIALHQEAKLLDQFWQYVVQAAQALTGKSQVFSYRKKISGMNGTVTQYQDGKITFVDATDNQTKVLALRELSPSCLIDITKRQNKDNPEFYHSLAAFYYANGSTDMAPFCRDACKKAEKLGVAAKDLEKYQKWAEGAVSETLAALTTKTDAQQALEDADKAKIAQDKAKKSLDDAWRIIRLIVHEYSQGKNESLFVHFRELREKVARDEVIKLNKIVKAQEGYSLTKMIENVYEYCLVCGHDGKLRCLECKGEGYLYSDPKVIKTAIVAVKKRVCPNCKSLGDIDCPNCLEKRRNREYLMLREWYKDL